LQSWCLMLIHISILPLPCLLLFHHLIFSSYSHFCCLGSSSYSFIPSLIIQINSATSLYL
jgi:hypothetical protein